MRWPTHEYDLLSVAGALNREKGEIDGRHGLAVGGPVVSFLAERVRRYRWRGDCLLLKNRDCPHLAQD
jgi:hypothetical protein